MLCVWPWSFSLVHFPAAGRSKCPLLLQPPALFLPWYRQWCWTGAQDEKPEVCLLSVIKQQRLRARLWLLHLLAAVWSLSGSFEFGCPAWMDSGRKVALVS